MALALLLPALLLLAPASSAASADQGWELEINILDTITTLADVIANQTFHLVDAYFGITLAEAQLRILLDWSWAMRAEQCPIGKMIAAAEEKLSRTLQLTEGRRDRNEPLWAVVNPKLWEISGVRRHAPLPNQGYTQPLTRYMDDEDLYAFAWEGSPNGEESDRCMMNLFHTCAVSPRCWHVESMRPSPRGYPLTHRLLFFLLARQLGCQDSPVFTNFSINKKIRDLCDNILIDSKIIQSMDYPSILRDLFAEQITFCGMVGFREYTNIEWIKRLLSWKTPSGCFPQILSRRKRNDFVADGCSMHFSGVGAGALAIALRNMLEETPLNGCMKASQEDFDRAQKNHQG